MSRVTSIILSITVVLTVISISATFYRYVVVGDVNYITEEENYPSVWDIIFLK